MCECGGQVKAELWRSRNGVRLAKRVFVDSLQAHVTAKYVDRPRSLMTCERTAFARCDATLPIQQANISYLLIASKAAQSCSDPKLNC